MNLTILTIILPDQKPRMWVLLLIFYKPQLQVTAAGGKDWGSILLTR